MTEIIIIDMQHRPSRATDLKKRYAQGSNWPPLGFVQDAFRLGHPAADVHLENFVVYIQIHAQYPLNFFTENQYFSLHFHWNSVIFTVFHWKSVFFTENQCILLKTNYDADLWPDKKMSGLELSIFCSHRIRSPTCPIWRLVYTVEQVTLYIIYLRKNCFSREVFTDKWLFFTVILLNISKFSVKYRFLNW